ncbi:MAG: hypothetical protein GC136_05445 [Alphaproteobacteria bacterium]|nr:hypothetical protein [Alphaproteobacteria bacterium]
MYKIICAFLMFLVMFGQFEVTRGQLGYNIVSKSYARGGTFAQVQERLRERGIEMAERRIERARCVENQWHSEFPELNQSLGQLSCGQEIIGRGMDMVQGLLNDAMGLISSLPGGAIVQMVLQIVGRIVRESIINLIQGFVCAPLNALKAGIRTFVPDFGECAAAETPADGTP